MRRAGVILICVLAGCGGDTGAETPIPPEGTPVALSDIARVRLGVIAGDSIEEFARIVTPFLLTDGRLVVPDNGKSSIRIFARDGSYQATLGRYGEGPGEFTALVGAWPRGDTIEAFDFQTRRITRFLPDGSRETILLTGGGRTDVAIPGALNDGWAVLRIDAAGMGQRDEVSVHGFDRLGAHQGELAKVQGFLRQQSSVGGGGPSPLSPRVRYGARAGTLYLAETYEPVIRTFGADGSVGEIRWDPGTPPAPDVALRAATDAAVAVAPADQAESRRRALEGYPAPTRVPVFWDFVVDDLGFVWVRPYNPSQHYMGVGPNLVSTGGDWMILSPTGVVVNTLALPPDLEPTHITRDAVVGIIRDELGVQYVAVYPLTRRMAG